MMRGVTVLRVAAAAAGAFLLSVFFPLPREDFSPESMQSLRVFDRNGVLLREFLNDNAGRGIWCPLSSIDSSVIASTLAIEDHRFGMHPGVDPIAVGRAFVSNIRSGGGRSGGSTITQQVIRNVYHHPRTLWYKLVEAWYALRLERMMSKRQILEQYLNRVPYGRQLYGIEAASRYYFGKPARVLSPAEAAFLAGLPNSPTFLMHTKDAAVQRQRVVLRRMLELRYLTPESFQRADAQPLHLLPFETPFLAPHVVEMVEGQVRSLPGVTSVTTTIDASLQKEVESVVQNSLLPLAGKNVSNASVVVIDNSTNEIVALVGSARYADTTIDGQVNGALALRQPGSAIKPFTYALALEHGYSAADLLADVPASFPEEVRDYLPENYDRSYHGPVRFRQALACSYNVPAVRLLRSLGIETLLDCLRASGITTLTQPGMQYGLGLTLGNGDITLLELTGAYTVFSHGGRLIPLKLVREALTAEGNTVTPIPGPAKPSRVFDERTSFIITDILQDPLARKPAFGDAFRFPFHCAVKTGTTKDYRDNWSLGYTTRYTVGVWAGNFNGMPMRHVSGVAGAGRIFTDVMQLLHADRGAGIPARFSPPKGLVRRTVCSRSGQLPTASCAETTEEWFLAERQPTERCRIHQAYRVLSGGNVDSVRVFEVYDAIYQDWARAQGIQQPPPGASRVRKGAPVSSPAEFAIISPGRGEQYKIDPTLRPEYQTICITAAIPDRISSPVLFIDGVNRSSFPREGYWWSLQKGEHTFQIQGRSRGKIALTNPVNVLVE